MPALVAAGDTNNQLNLTTFTYEQWFEFAGASLPTGWSFIGGKSFSTGRAFTLWVNGLGFVHSSIGSTYTQSANGSIVAGRWYDAVTTYDGSILKLYINGVLVGTSAYSAVSGGSTSTTFTVGEYDSTISYPTSPNYVGDTVVWSNVLNAAQIYKHWISSALGSKLTAGVSGNTPSDAYGVSVAADNPTVWYRLNDSGSSTTAGDSAAASQTGTGFTKSGALPGTVNGAAMGVPGSPTVVGNTVAGFDGNKGFISVPNSSPIQFTSTTSGTTAQKYSIEMWFNPSYLNGSTSTYYSLLSKGNASLNGGRGYGIQLRGDGTLTFVNAGVYGNSFNIISTAVPAGSIQVGHWYHLVEEWDGTNAYAFLNGQLALAATAVASGAMDITNPLYIGSDGTGTPDGDDFRGSIAEVALYNNVNLSAARINEHFYAAQITNSYLINAVGTNGAVTLSWSAPTVLGGAPIVGYKILRGTAGTLGPELTGAITSPTTLTANTGSTSTTYVDSSVSNGTLYYYQVVPVTAAAITSLPVQPSSVVAALPLATPGAITGLSAVTVGAGAASLSWTAPSNIGGGLILGYTIARSTDGQNYTTIGTTTSLSYLDNLAALGRTTWYQVAAYNTAGTGSYTSTQFVPTLAPGVVGGVAPNASAASSYAAAVGADNPLIWWRMNDTATVTSEVNAGTGGTSLNATVTGSITGAYNSSTNASPTSAGVGVATIPAISGSTGSNSSALVNSSATSFPAWSAEGWVKLASMPTTALDLINKGVGTGQNFALGVNSAGAVTVSLAYGATGGTQYTNSTIAGLIQAGNWYYLTETYDGATLRLYINGTLVNAWYVNVVADAASTGSLAVDPTTGDTSWASHPAYQVAELAVYRTALTQERIRAHWLSSTYAQAQAAISDPYGNAVSGDNPLLWVRLQDAVGSTTAVNSGSIGIAGNGTLTSRAGANAGAPVPIAGAFASPTMVGATAYQFDGITGVVSIPSTAASAIIPAASGTNQDATKPFSVEFWVNLLTLPSSSTYYDLAGRTSTTTAAYDYFFEAHGATLCFLAGYIHYICANNALSAGQWLHIVGTYNGTNQSNATDMALYINGVLQTAATSSTTVMVPSTVPMATFIGGSNFITGNGLPGYMSEYAMYGSVLTQAQIMKHYRAAAITNAPTVLASAGNGATTLTWTSPSTTGGTPPIGYTIQRCTGACSSWTTIVANTNSTATSYQDLTSTNGALYGYQVAAINSGAAGGTQTGPWSTTTWSNPGAIPGSVPGLAAAPGIGQVALTWNAPTSSPGIIGYQYAYADSTGIFSTPQLLSASTTSFTQTGLIPGATYTFEIQAINAVGSGPFATVQSGPLSGVVGLSGTSANTSVLLTWKPPTSTGGLAISGYEIWSWTGAGTPPTSLSSWTTQSANTGTTSTNYNITGLTNGTLYYFTVAPLLGSSNLQGPTVATSATPNVGPAAPLNLSVVPGAAQVTLNWSPVVDPNYNVMGYWVDYSADNGQTWTPSNSSSAPPIVGTTAMVGVGGVGNTALVNNQTYLFRVRTAYLNGGANTVGGAATVSGAALAAVTRPSSLSAIPTAPGVASLAWVAPTGATGQLTQAYQIQTHLTSDTSTVWQTAVANTGSQTPTWMLSGLTPGAQYWIRVSAITATYTTPPSDTVTVTILGSPNTPTNFVANPTDSTISLSWNPPTPSQGVTITGYQVDYSLNSVDWTPLATNDAATFRATAFGLVNGV